MQARTEPAASAAARALLLAACAAAALLGPASPARAQQIQLEADDFDPVTKLKAEQWIRVMTRTINGPSVTGRPEVFMLNATGEPLTVKCDRWVLVGPPNAVASDVKGNPSALPPWKITIVHTEKFDGYCKDGLTGLSESGRVYKAAVVSPDNTFTNATVVTFWH